MTGYDIYVFVLCLVVFAALTCFFVAITTSLVRMYLKNIQGGMADEELKKQRAKEKRHAAISVFEKTISVLIAAIAITVFALSLDAKVNEKEKVDRSVVKVVKSQSMSTKNENNKYLVDNNLDNQFQMFDLIGVSSLPDENELKLYDIVVYEVDGQMVVHRIVGIEEPDETHSQRWFVLKGDANAYADKIPILYSQMKGIYNGKRVAYIGSFVVFMNSPAGYLCIILVLCACVAYPLIERKVKKATDLRLAQIGNDPQAAQEEEISNSDASQTQQNEAPVEANTVQDECLDKQTVQKDNKEESEQPNENGSSTQSAGGNTAEFVKPRAETLDEKYAKLSKEKKAFYDEIVAYAAQVGDCKRIKNDRYEEYKSGNTRLVRVLIKRGDVVCEYMMPNDNFKRYVAGNKVKVKSSPVSLKIADENTLQAAKDSVDIAKKIIDDEKAYRKEQAKIHRAETKHATVRKENE